MIGNLEEENAGGGGVVPGTNVSIQNQLLGVQSALLAMQQENLELKTSLTVMKVCLERGFEVFNGNVRQIALHPVRRVAAPLGVVDGQGEADMGAANDLLAMMATVMPTPRSLHDLWSEYLHGVGGRKPARLFSYTERGRSKHHYCHRKIVWDTVSGLVRQGHTSEFKYRGNCYITILFAVFTITTNDLQ
jgi:hypothetical protein